MENFDIVENEIVAEDAIIENEIAEDADAEVAEGTKKDPLEKFNKLDADKQALVQGIVDDVVERLGGDEIDIDLLYGVLAKLNAEKKTAKEVAKTKAKEAKEAAKQEAKANAEKLKGTFKAGDTVKFKTAKIDMLTAKVIKVTDSGNLRVEIVAETPVLYNGKEVTMADVPEAVYKTGIKTVKLINVIADVVENADAENADAENADAENADAENA